MSTFVGSDLFNNPALSRYLPVRHGPSQPASVIGSGLVLDLTSHFFERGWDKAIPETVVSTTSSDGRLRAVGDAV
ncbi:MAG: hypothetical protein ACR2RE_17050 [Geminicoccaceae bacterium]